MNLERNIKYLEEKAIEYGEVALEKNNPFLLNAQLFCIQKSIISRKVKILKDHCGINAKFVFNRKTSHMSYTF